MTPNNRMYCNLTDGRKCSMPRYYKHKMYTELQREEIGQATLVRLRQQKQHEMDRNPKYYWEFQQKQLYSLRLQKDDHTTETL